MQHFTWTCPLFTQIHVLQIMLSHLKTLPVPPPSLVLFLLQLKRCTVKWITVIKSISQKASKCHWQLVMNELLVYLLLTEEHWQPTGVDLCQPANVNYHSHCQRGYYFLNSSLHIWICTQPFLDTSKHCISLARHVDLTPNIKRLIQLCM